MKRRIIKFTVLALIVLIVANMIIESRQAYFPMKENEISWIEVADDPKHSELYYVLDKEAQAEFVALMNHVALVEGDDAVGTMAHEGIEDYIYDPHKNEVEQYVRIYYHENLFQRKTGLQLWFFGDNSFMISEVQRADFGLPLHFVWESIVSDTVYENGFEAFTNATENRAACAELIQWIGDYRSMREATKDM